MKHNKDSSSINVLDWIENTKNDLKLAEIGSQYDVIASLICFHAQQAAEKALKAVLLHHKINFPLVHDLEALLTLLEKNVVCNPYNLSKVRNL